MKKCAKRSKQLVKDRCLVVLEHLSFLHFQWGNWPFLCSRAWLGVLTWVGGMQDTSNNACVLTKMMAKILQFHQTCLHRQWGRTNEHGVLEFTFYFTCKPILWTTNDVLYKSEVQTHITGISIVQKPRACWSRWWSRYGSGEFVSVNVCFTTTLHGALKVHTTTLLDNVSASFYGRVTSKSIDTEILKRVRSAMYNLRLAVRKCFPLLSLANNEESWKIQTLMQVKLLWVPQ